MPKEKRSGSRGSSIARSRNRSIVDSPDLGMTSGGTTLTYCVNYRLISRYMEFLRNPDGFLSGQMGNEPYYDKEFQMAWRLVLTEEQRVYEYLKSLGFTMIELVEEDVPGLEESSSSTCFKIPNLASYESFKEKSKRLKSMPMRTNQNEASSCGVSNEFQVAQVVNEAKRPENLHHLGRSN